MHPRTHLHTCTHARDDYSNSRRNSRSMSSMAARNEAAVSKCLRAMASERSPSSLIRCSMSTSRWVWSSGVGCRGEKVGPNLGTSRLETQEGRLLVDSSTLELDPIGIGMPDSTSVLVSLTLLGRGTGRNLVIELCKDTTDSLTTLTMS